MRWAASVLPVVVAVGACASRADQAAVERRAAARAASLRAASTLAIAAPSDGASALALTEGRAVPWSSDDPLLSAPPTTTPESRRTRAHAMAYALASARSGARVDDRDCVADRLVVGIGVDAVLGLDGAVLADPRRDDVLWQAVGDAISECRPPVAVP